MRARLATLAIAVAALAARGGDAHAFCGFYVGGAGARMFNNATEVVMMRHGTTTVLSMQNNYQGPPEHFAMVVPVPVVIKKDQVQTLPRDLFDKVDTLGAPRLVEYWEQDPCYQPPPVEVRESLEDMPGAAVRDEAPSDDDDKDYHVTIEAQFSVGEYDIVVLSATQSTGLDRWLHDNHYEIPKGAEPLLRPYVEAGTKFFVAKVDPKKVAFKDGMATLSPLRFYYDSPEFTLPIRLGLANSSGTQDLIVNILAPNTRYEVANRPNVTIPTNLLVTDAVRTRFGEFYAALFDHVLEKVPGAVVTEYAWDSGSCDPCPGPTLDQNDIATLGGDVIARNYKDTGYYGYTLTRLHARYGTDIHDDLVFRAVSPIVGGRGIPDPQGKVPEGATDAGTNNFQGRYIILHPWTGEVACADPRRGVWGGPPAQQIATPAVVAATGTAFVPRGKVALGSMVAEDVPSIGVTRSKGLELPPPVRKPQGCGCASGGGAAPIGLALGVVLVALRPRRRRHHLG
jgi:MYXO-CTERM domain-containing protein